MYHNKIINEVSKLFNTHVKAVRDLRNNYPEVAKIIKNRDHVIITNNGKSEAVIIPYEQLKDYQNYLYDKYVEEKLAEAEALEDNPDNWLSIDEFMENIKKWRQKNEV